MNRITFKSFLLAMSIFFLLPLYPVEAESLYELRVILFFKTVTLYKENPSGKGMLARMHSELELHEGTIVELLGKEKDGTTCYKKVKLISGQGIGEVGSGEGIGEVGLIGWIDCDSANFLRVKPEKPEE